MDLDYEPQVMRILLKFCGSDVGFAKGILRFDLLILKGSHLHDDFISVYAPNSLIRV
jgi:hypothetical protein